MAAAHNPASEGFHITASGLSALFDHVGEAILCCASGGEIRFVSEAVRQIIGLDPRSMVGHNVVDFLHPDDITHAAEALARWEGRAGTPAGEVVRLRSGDGEWVAVRYDASIGEDLGTFGSLVITLRPAEEVDATERDLRLRALNEARIVRIASAFLHGGPHDFGAAVDLAVAELASLDNVTRVTVWRADESRVLLQARWDASVNAPLSAVPPRARIDSMELLQRVAEGEEVLFDEPWAHGDRFPNERRMMADAELRCFLAMPMMSGERFVGMLALESTLAGCFGAHHVATARSASAILGAAFLRHDTELRLAHQARTDLVTGLENRRAFDERLATAIDHVRAGRSSGFGLAIVDLDRFKLVNDSLGHAAGDRLLADVAARLTGAATPSTTLARMGGDEMLVLVDDLATPDEALAAVEGLLGALAAPFEVGDGVIVLEASAGVVHDADGKLDAGDILRWADVALYQAKALGGGTAVLDDPSGHDRQSARMKRESELHRAVHEGDLIVHYQGEWDMATGELVGAEALVRWPHPEDGLLRAGDFVPMAEATGLINELGRFVLRRACREAVPWAEARPAGGFVLRVNMAARQLRQPDLVDQVADALHDSGLPAEALCLELTESTLLADPAGAQELFEQLRRLGVGLAIDDFGTGYSSLLQLKALPLTSLKIDQGFVAGLPDSDTDRAIVQATLGLAGALGIRVTAEGVETEGQRDALLALGCHRAQGYLLGEPGPPEALTRS